MSFRAPTAEMLFCMRHVAGLDRDIADGLHGDLSVDLVGSILEEAGRFGADVIAPLNRIGDRHGTPFADGRVTTPPGWRDAYRAWCEAGWSALAGPASFGGQDLPTLVSVACTEIWNAASMAFGVGPVLTMGAVEALATHGSPDLKARYLARLVSGEWTGTMNLTEPAAGSDLSALTTKAERSGEGTYRLTGTKIYITYGEHDLADNIVHLVLARLPDAPPGTRGISLFLVPKILPDGTANDLRCTGVEGKLGIHGSPTCTMSYGDRGGATGWLVGEENCGLACMFTMMNNARLQVGIQGVAIAERAFQGALAWARERRQGRVRGAAGEGASPIIHHPDVQRMLMTMMSSTAAARAICYGTAALLDRARLSADPARRAASAERAALLIPVAKAFATDTGVEVASLGIQVHGGAGYVEETGAAQHLRDARIASIYEGTNGIQAIDLVTRKLPAGGGAAMRREIARLRQVGLAVAAGDAHAFGSTAARLREALDALDEATGHLLSTLDRGEDATAAAVPYLRLFALALGAGALAEAALAGLMANDAAGRGRVVTARFFAETLLPAASGLAAAVTAGAGALTDAPLALAG